MRTARPFLFALILFLAPALVKPAEPPAATFDFEQGEVGQAPAGWTVSPQMAASYAIRLTDEKPQAGKLCAVLVSIGPLPTQGVGWALRSLDAAPYRGKRVRFRAQARVELGEHGQRGRLMLGSGRAAQSVFEGTSQPIRQNQWAAYEAVGDIPKDAKAVELGIALLGDGKAFLDSVSLEVIGEAGAGNEPARALTPRGLENLTAFARLFGYVRYFHPSDEAAAADWEALALAGVQATEKAASSEELAQSLADFFRPVAPTLKVFPTAHRPAPAELNVPAPPEGKPRIVVSWEHYGLGMGPEPSIYHSTRVNDSPQAADPLKPFEADLPGGVTVRVPLALYKDDQGTLPHGPAVKPTVAAKPEGFIPTGNDRTTRLADVVLAWNVFQHFYPYFDVVAVDWPAQLQKALAAAATDADDHAFQDTLRRLVAALQDGHGNVFNPRLNASHSLPVSWDWVEDQLVVTAVAPGTAGVARGDVVVSLDGKPARAVLEAREELVSGATPQWRQWVALNALTGGDEGEEVRLALRHPDGTAASVTLRRTLPNQGWQTVPETRPEKIAEVKPGIFYVDLDRISDDDFKGALDRLAAAKGIIFDLRGYPKVSPIVLAHLTSKTISSARWYVPIVFRPDHQDLYFDFSNWPVEPQPPRFPGKVAFLTDGRAISYAETYMGIVENYKLAAIVGGPTAGTNGNVNPFTLPGGYRLVWTGMKVLKHDGSRHHGIGIQPTVPVSRTLAGVAAGRDEVLEKGIAVVSPAAATP
ncbi:MAG TPA: S41 family peptidase [Thermoanaerobaculia bacterium]|nr:S41 family peptidase [Thermoanaerobaculia bacterium]